MASAPVLPGMLGLMERSRIAVAGASGLIGSALVRSLRAGGHEVVFFARGKNLAAHRRLAQFAVETRAGEELVQLGAVVDIAQSTQRYGFGVVAERGILRCGHALYPVGSATRSNPSLLPQTV